MVPFPKIPANEIHTQIDKICSSNELTTKLQLCRLLRYLVDETLAGREEKLKGYTIGVEAFNKQNDFDPEMDPIVRIHAGRLRRMLRIYYLETGINDPIKIEIPKGKYVPRFSLDTHNYKGDAGIRYRKNQSATIKPTIVVLPFKNLTGNPKKDYFALGFAEELSVELTRFEDLSVFSSIAFSGDKFSDDEKLEFIKSQDVRFYIEGGVSYGGNKIKILVKLVDVSKNLQIWAERYSRTLTSNNLIKIQENIACEISFVLGSEYGIILQQLSIESKRIKPQSIDSFYAILKFYYFEASQSIEDAASAFKTLKQALLTDPDSGIVAAMLASMYGNQYMLDMPFAENAYEQMGLLTEKAIKLDPNSLIVRVNLVWKCFVYNERERFFKEVDKCLSMNPISAIRLGSLGHCLSLYGDWEQGKTILDRVMSYNANFPLYYFGSTCLYYYRKKEYNKALVEANQYNIPALFWGPLLRTAVLGQLKSISEAKANIIQLKQLKPNFEEKAQYLISQFVKEEDLAEKVMEGLRKAGMHL